MPMLAFRDLSLSLDIMLPVCFAITYVNRLWSGAYASDGAHTAHCCLPTRKVCSHEAASKGYMMSTRVGRRHHCSHIYSTDLTVVPPPTTLRRRHAHPPKTLCRAGRPAPRARFRPPADMGLPPARDPTPLLCQPPNTCLHSVSMLCTLHFSPFATALAIFDWCAASG